MRKPVVSISGIPVGREPDSKRAVILGVGNAAVTKTVKLLRVQTEIRIWPIVAGLDKTGFHLPVRVKLAGRAFGKLCSLF